MPFRFRFPTTATRILTWAIAGALGIADAAITVTEAPAGMRKQNADITLSWTGGNGRVHLRASTVPGRGAVADYDSLHLPTQPGSGGFTFRINPDIPVAYRNTDLRFGINHCILTDGVQASPEFLIIVESGSAPALVSPSNAASIKDLTPTFSWSGDAPYYAILVSDEPFKIADDGTVSGVSAIWQAITPYKSIRYGEADPSGINQVPAPPLISGKTYNWLVLNNYGNNSASTSKVAPVPASFAYAPAAPLPSVQLLEPKDADTVAGADRILFRWSLVDGAVSYKIELLEENIVDGSQADIALWKASSTGGQAYLDNASGLLRRFNYKWRVYAVGSNGAASLSAKRSFFYDAKVGDITVALRNAAGQKIAYAPVKLNRLGSASSAVYQSGSTDNDGTLSIKNAPLGGYEARIENLDGYLAKTDTILHASTTGTSQSITLSPVLGKILGRVISAADGTGVLNAKVVATGTDGTQATAVTNSQGDYSLGVPYGTWQVRAQANGYVAATPASVSLSGSAPSKTADFPLSPDRYTLSGSVQNSFSRQGIFGAAVTLAQGTESRTLNTDGNGSYSFPVSNGAYTLRVSCAGFAAPEPRSLSIDGDKTLNIALDPNASILTGRTKDVSGTALANATVTATPKAGPVRSAVSDATGAFELSLPAGDWNLAASAQGYSSAAERKFLLDASKTVQGVDFTFEPNRSAVRGRVTANGSGLAGARIASGDASAISDNSGYYLLSLKAGTQSVTAAKDGYLIPKSYSVPVNAGDTVAGIDFAATGNAGQVKGRALSGGAGVVGAVIRAVNQATLEAFQGNTDGTGAYSLSLPGGEYAVTASKEGFAQEQALAFSLQPGGILQDADVRLAADVGGISGTVSSGNASLAGCEVAYRNPANAALAGRTVTDPQGRYSLSLQANAAYALTASCPGYQSATSTSAVLARGGSLAADFNLAKAGASFRGKVVDGGGAPIPGVRITAERGGEAAAQTSDFSGAYAFSLGAGTYAMTFSKTGFKTTFRTTQLSLGENASATDTLAASIGRIQGRVVSDGAGVAGALVALTGLSPEAGGGSFTTDGDGRFSSDNVPAGSYSLAATAEGFAEGKLTSLTVAAGGLASPEVALVANRGVLAGTVKVDGSAAPNVNVVADAYGVSRSVLSAANGSFRIDRLPAGTYAVSASLSGYSPDKTYDGRSLAAAATVSGLDFNLTRNAGSLSGTVSGAASASGIRISIAGKKGYRAYATCDGTGKYSIPALPSDTYVLTVAAPGYKLSGNTQAPEVAVGASAEYNPSLVPAVFRLSGKAMNQAGSGIAGLPIELRAGTERFSAVSGADGAFSFSAVPAGQDYRLACMPPTSDYDSRDTSFSLGLDAPAQVTADLTTLSRTASFAGTVFLDDAPVEGATIRLSGEGNNLVTLSQPKGLFKVPGVAGSSSDLRLSVAMPGANTLDTSLKIGVGESKAGLSVRLKTLKLKLEAALRDSEGKVLKAAKLAVASSGKPDTLIADANGIVTVTGIPANRSLTLATLLDRNRYDNAGAAVFLKEKDSSLTLEAAVHATSATVQVLDKTGAAVDGAEVLMNGKSLGKTVQGKAGASGLARGTYRFSSGKAGYKSGADQTISVSGDTSFSVSLQLTQVAGGVYGGVSDSGVQEGGGVVAGRALPGAIVIAVAGADTLRDTVNSLGQYSLDGMVDGTKYALSSTLPGYLPLLDSIVAGASAQSRDLRLRPIPGSVLGRVQSGAAGERVILSHAASGQITTVSSRAGGYFAFTGLRNREDYSLQAVSGALSSQAVSFLADAGSARRIDATLERWGGIGGTVTGGPANAAVAVAGALVSVRNTLTGAVTWTLTDSLGGYALSGLASGSHELKLERKGYRSPDAVSLAISKGVAAAKTDFRLEEADAGVSGLVTDETGKGLSAAVALVNGSDTSKVETDGSGQFVFSGLSAGTYALSAAKAGYASPAPAGVVYSGSGIKTRNLALTRRSNLLFGSVLDALTNRPVAGATVRALTSPPISATVDSLGRYELALPAGASVPVYMEAAQDGYLPRTAFPVFPDDAGSAAQDIALAADYKFDGQIAVSVKEGADAVGGLSLAIQSLHPDDSLRFSVTGQAPSSFRDLRRPAPYVIKVKRDGFKELSKVVELTAGNPTLDVTLRYPTSAIRVFVTGDGKKGRGTDLSLNGERLRENQDTAGLYASEAKLKPGSYEVSIRDQAAGLIPLSQYFIALGEDSIRTDTLPQPFYAVAIADSAIGSSFKAGVLRTDSLHPAPAVVCSLYYRPKGDPLWKPLAMDSVAGGFSATVPAQPRPGVYEYYHALRSPSGSRIGIVTPAGDVAPSGRSSSTAPLVYTDAQTPGEFTLRDPYLLNSIALLPQRLEADTSLYSLRGRDLWQVNLRGEKGVSLDGYFDEKSKAGDTAYSVSWSFADAAKASAAGLSLAPDASTPRLCKFSGGASPSDSVFEVICSARMGAVRLGKSFFVKIQDLTPVSIGIRFAKENRVLDENGAALPLSNRSVSGYLFSAFAKTAKGREFNISPRWTFGGDSAAGSISQQGLFLPDSAVARSATLLIMDTLQVAATGSGQPLYQAFSSSANLATFTQVVPSASGRAVVTNGEGAVLDFNLAGLSKAFTVSVKKPKVSGLLRASPQQEVVGDILDIELSERQPFKADSGAILKMPVGPGFARRHKVFLGHWISDRLAWEKVDSAKGDTAVEGKVYSFSNYAVLMGSEPLGAYDFIVAPNPFSAEDPWGLQLGYKVSSDISSQVGVRVEVYNMMGDKIYESQEQLLSKGQTVVPGTHKAAVNSASRKAELGPFVWDGHDKNGAACRNGRYLLKLIVRDGQGSKEYLKKVVMLK